MTPTSFKPGLLQLHGWQLKPLGNQDIPEKRTFLVNYYIRESIQLLTENINLHYSNL